MNTESTTIAQETFDSLPLDIQELVFSDEYQSILTAIGEKYKLSKEQMNQLELQTTLVVMGVAKRSYFPFDLESEVGLDEDTAETMSREIHDVIFSTIEDSLDKIERDEIGGVETIDKKVDRDENHSINAPSPSEVLANLGARLSQSSVIVPSKRDYSVVKSQEPSIETLKPSLDPYRELPEK